jgi:hypothetical protein
MEKNRSLENYNHLLEQLKGNKETTTTCLKMMTWLIKDIEINLDINLNDYKEIWEEAYNISLNQNPD